MADGRNGDREGGYRRRDSIFDDDNRQDARGGRSEGEPWGAGNDQAGGPGSSQPGGRGGSSTFDDHYLSWRERQISQLDQDYADYCRDRQQQFETDFHGWRQGRQGQSGGSGGSSAAAVTAGGGGEASATESSTGSSATTGSGAPSGRKAQETK